MGEMLSETVEDRGIKIKGGSTQRTTLPSLPPGITKKESHIAQSMPRQPCHIPPLLQVFLHLSGNFGEINIISYLPNPPSSQPHYLSNLLLGPAPVLIREVPIISDYVTLVLLSNSHQVRLSKLGYFSLMKILPLPETPISADGFFSGGEVCPLF